MPQEIKLPENQILSDIDFLPAPLSKRQQEHDKVLMKP
jgi:hypothetical protein